jgi:large subunit ribosomal protein L23
MSIYKKNLKILIFMTTLNEKQKKWIEVLEVNTPLSMVDLVKYPVITEKTYLSLYKNRQYTFDIDKRLTKTQIKKLFSSLFKVNVIAVNTHIPPRKKIRVGMAQGFRPTYKRAIITLKEGDSINYNLTNVNSTN